jgi:hypothetical protein
MKPVDVLNRAVQFYRLFELLEEASKLSDRLSYRMEPRGSGGLYIYDEDVLVEWDSLEEALTRMVLVTQMTPREFTLLCEGYEGEEDDELD